ncbi:PQQ-binding-like beta-propeller repeat protein [Streptomyces profundus]|uniref:outer membrane protein assembly factor BamB family protein n=1 Tax=Streptomyces profundus TaxID=2867410 RepID=UPI001D16F3F0|nr:PQQ-binding-like beta-propeller repeat protein [Streptomyces sp. MA3_2.13]UED87805.1 PQQ-like beta-propeller repeat protein [Streptomyces sp. MA3_2.13]
MFLILTVVVLLIVGGGFARVLLTGDDDNGGGGDTDEVVDDPAGPAEGTLAWDLPSPGVSAEDLLLSASGTWFTEDTVVRLMDTAVVAHDLDSGEESWTFPVERLGGDSECLASPRADQNRIAVLQGRDCEAMTVLDITTGEEITTFPVDLPVSPGRDEAPALLGDTVAIGSGIQLGSAAYRVSDGSELWRHSVLDDPCADISYQVLDETLVALTRCGGQEATDGGEVRGVAEDGRELWSWAYGPELDGEPMEVNAVLSAEPLVVHAAVGEEREARLFVVHDNHTGIAHTLDFTSDRYVSPCLWRTCDAAVVADGRLALVSTTRATPTVVTFDLATGEPLYETEPVGGHDDIRPFDSLDGAVLAYQPGVGQQPGAVVTIDPASGEATELMTLDPEAAAQEAAVAGNEAVTPNLLLHHIRPRWDAASDTFVLSNETFHAGGVNPPAMLVYR